MNTQERNQEIVERYMENLNRSLRRAIVAGDVNKARLYKLKIDNSLTLPSKRGSLAEYNEELYPYKPNRKERRDNRKLRTA